MKSLVSLNREEPLEPVQLIIFCYMMQLHGNSLAKIMSDSTLQWHTGSTASVSFCFGVKDLIWPILLNGFLRREWEQISAANFHIPNAFPREVEGGGCIFNPVASEWDHQKALGVWCNIWVSNIEWSMKEGWVCGEGTKCCRSGAELAEDWWRRLPWGHRGDEDEPMNER